MLMSVDERTDELVASLGDGLDERIARLECGHLGL